MAETEQVEYETALNMTGFARYNIRMFFLCTCIVVGHAFEVYSIIYLVSASACELDTTSKQKGTLMSLPALVVLVSGHMSGYLSDTKGRRKFLLISTVVSFIISVTAAFSPHWIVLFTLKLVSGICMAFGNSLSQLLLSECTPMAKRRLTVMLSTSVLLVTLGMMAVISIPILSLKFSYHIPILNITFNGWRLLSLLYSIPSAIAAIAAYHTFDSPKQLLSFGKEDKSIEVLRLMYVMNTGRSGDKYKVNALFLNEDKLAEEPKGIFKSILVHTLPIFKRPFRRCTHVLPIVSAPCFICFVVIVKYLIFTIDIFVKSFQNGDANLTVCGTIAKYQNRQEKDQDCSINNYTMTIIFGLFITLAVLNLIVCGLANYVSRKNLLIGIQIISGFSLLFINISPYWILSGIIMMTYLCNITNYGVFMSYIFDIYPTYIRATTVCLLTVIAYGNPDLIFRLVPAISNNPCEHILYTFGGFTCLTGLLCMLLPTEEKILELNKRKEVIEQ